MAVALSDTAGVSGGGGPARSVHREQLQNVPNKSVRVVAVGTNAHHQAHDAGKGCA